MNLTPDLVIADRFRLLSPLGKGGMGEVWLAQHLGLDIRCAVKFINPEAARSTDVRTRFQREARAVAQIQSPHVVQIFDYGVWNDSPYIAMEYLIGQDLAQRLEQRRKLSPQETLVVVADVSRALGKAHAVGLVHRDLKPSNIFLVRDDEREIAKVLDFGIAKDMSLGQDSSTKTGAMLGTPFYMSPEQARGTRTIDQRADLWGVGVIAYQCLTGSLPFMADALGLLFLKIMIEPIPVPSEIAPVPPGFDAWWARAMAREPSERFQSARELTDALAIALGLSSAGSREWRPSLSSSPGTPPAEPRRGGTAVMLETGPRGAPAAYAPYTPNAPQPLQDAAPSALSTETGPRLASAGYVSAAPVLLTVGGATHARAQSPYLTPLQQTVTMPPKVGPSGGVILGAVVVGALVLGGGVFLALRSGSPNAVPSPASGATVAGSAASAPVVD